MKLACSPRYFRAGVVLKDAGIWDQPLELPMKESRFLGMAGTPSFEAWHEGQWYLCPARAIALASEMGYSTKWIRVPRPAFMAFDGTCFYRAGEIYAAFAALNATPRPVIVPEELRDGF